MLEIGSGLREARSRAGFGLAEVETATMIPRRYLEALEQERFEFLPDGPYRRSFLREYALFLGLEGDTYAGEYDRRFAPREPEPPGPPPRRRDRIPLFIGEISAYRAAAVAAVAALLGVAVWQLAGSSGPPRARSTPAASQPQTGIPSRTRQAAATHRRAAAGEAPSAEPRPMLALTATRGNCWLSVHVDSRSGPTVYEQTLRRGETIRLGLRQLLWIRVGAPWNLDATIGQRIVTSTLPSSTADVVASPAGLRPAA